MIKEVSEATPGGKDLAEGSLSAERREVYREVANKQTHRNVGLLTGRPEGSGVPVFDTCFSQTKDKARVREKELIVGPDNRHLGVSTRKTDSITAKRATRQSKAQARPIKEERRRRARRRAEANNNTASPISFTRRREGPSTFAQSLSGGVF